MQEEPEPNSWPLLPTPQQRGLRVNLGGRGHLPAICCLDQDQSAQVAVPGGHRIWGSVLVEVLLRLLGVTT